MAILVKKTMVLDVDYNQSLYLPKVVLNTKMNANDQHSSAVRVRFGTRLTRKKMRSERPYRHRVLHLRFCATTFLWVSCGSVLYEKCKT